MHDVYFSGGAKFALIVYICYLLTFNKQCIITVQVILTLIRE